MKPNFDKQEYKALKADAKLAGIFTAVRQVETYSNHAYNGVAVAFRPVSERPGCRMLEVAVSYSAPEDIFRRKTGKYQALRKFEYGETIQVPLAGFFHDCGPEEAGLILLNTFNCI